MVYTTNHAEIVECAKRYIKEYPTIENLIPKEKNHYENTIENYAAIDSKLAAANSSIGESSNLAQLALTYSYNYDDSSIKDYIAILSVLAQCSIDNAKRTFDVDIVNEIKRIKRELDVEAIGLPYFWFMLKRKNKFAAPKKKKKEVNEEKKEMKKLNKSLVCPMNYVCDLRFTAPKYSKKAIPMDSFFVKHPLKHDRRRSVKVEKLIEKYEIENSKIVNMNEGQDILDSNFEEFIEELKMTHVSKDYAGVFSFLIDRAFKITTGMKNAKTNCASNLWRNRPMLLRVLYAINPDILLSCFAGNINEEKMI